MKQIRTLFRSVRKYPGHSSTVIGALALGIGMAAAIFGMVEAMVMRPFDFPRLDRVVAIYETIPSAGPERYEASPGNFLEWAKTTTSFERMAAYRRWAAGLTTPSGAEPIDAYKVSPSFFSVTQTEPLIGRTFSQEAVREPDALVVSYRFWRNRLGGASNVIGQTLTIEKSPYVIVGVMPESFDFPIAGEAWAPLVLTVEEKVDHTDGVLGVIARLKPNVSVERAQQEMTGVAKGLEHEYPTENASRSAEVVLLRRSVNRYADSFLSVLMIAVVVLLVLACANVANLQLARAAMRRKEFAIKVALGAGRRRVIAEIVAENLFCSLVAAAMGIPIASVTLRLIKATVTSAVIHNAAGLMHAKVSTPVLGFAVVLAIISAFFVTVPTVIQTADIHLTEVLNAESRGSGGSVRRGVRSVLVGSQIALATFLLLAAVMLVSSFINLMRVPLGYDPQGVVIYHTSLSARDYPDGFRVVQFFDEALRGVREIPGVQTASVASGLPSLGDSETANLSREGQRDTSRPFPAEIRIVGPDYFRALSIDLHYGREFLPTDNEKGRQVTIVSESVARRLWPRQDILERRVEIGPGRMAVVVGVVADVNHFLLDHEIRPVIYRPLAQVATRSMFVVARTKGTLDRVPAQIRSVMAKVDGNERVYTLETFEGVLTNMSGGVRVVAALLFLVGVIALALAFAGVYAVLSYLIAVQSREIAIRMSLGATRRRVVRMFITYFLKIAVPSVTLGVSAGVIFGRALSRLVSSIEVTPSLVAVTVVAVSCASVIATILPARRVAMISPAATMR